MPRGVLYISKCQSAEWGIVHSSCCCEAKQGNSYQCSNKSFCLTGVAKCASACQGPERAAVCKAEKKKTTLQEPPSACEHNITSASQGYSCPCLLRINLRVPHTPLHCKHSKAKWPLSFLRGRLADSHPLLALTSWILCRHTSLIIRKVHFLVLCSNQAVHFILDLECIYKRYINLIILYPLFKSFYIFPLCSISSEIIIGCNNEDVYDTFRLLQVEISRLKLAITDIGCKILHTCMLLLQMSLFSLVFSSRNISRLPLYIEHRIYVCVVVSVRSTQAMELKLACLCPAWLDLSLVHV